MGTNQQTTPVLTGITHDGPVRFTRIDVANGMSEVFMPDDFPFMVDLVNFNGGPSAWEITPL